MKKNLNNYLNVLAYYTEELSANKNVYIAHFSSTNEYCELRDRNIYNPLTGNQCAFIQKISEANYVCVTNKLEFSNTGTNLLYCLSLASGATLIRTYTNWSETIMRIFNVDIKSLETFFFAGCLTKTAYNLYHDIISQPLVIEINDERYNFEQLPYSKFDDLGEKYDFDIGIFSLSDSQIMSS